MLVVDGANVVGSVPDGWWHDRAGAATRLHRELVAGYGSSEGGFDNAVLVLEGAARAGVAPGQDGTVTTVHASGEGDDEIVAQCRAACCAGAEVTLATADRGLIARVASLGVAVVGPRSVCRRS